MHRISVVVAFALLSCTAWQNVQCEQSANCDLSAGGECLAATTGNLWCAYPDPSCMGGYRYSDDDVGDGLSGVCVPSTGSGSACGSDADCAGMSGTPFCAPSGACVACLDNSACGGATSVCDIATNTCVSCLNDTECTSAQAPVCDGSAHACRGCEQDSECASGICLESNGTCADLSTVLYVSSEGSDSGNCPQAEPCLTLNYALLKLSTPYSVIRIMGAQYAINSTVATNSSTVGYIDGNMTTVTRGGSGYLFNIDGGNTAISGLVLDSYPDNGSGLEIEGGRVMFVDAVLKGEVMMSGGEVDVSRSAMQYLYAIGSSTVIDAEDSQLTGVTSPGSVTFERDTFDDPDAEIDVTGHFVIENSVLVATDAYDDPLQLGGTSTPPQRF